MLWSKDDLFKRVKILQQAAIRNTPVAREGNMGRFLSELKYRFTFFKSILKQ